MSTITIGGTYRFDYKARRCASAEPGMLAEHTGRPVTVMEAVCTTDNGTLYECRTADGAALLAYDDELSEV